MTTKTKITLQDTPDREAWSGSLGPRVNLEGFSILRERGGAYGLII